MADMMTFPDTVEEFMEQYKIVDTEQIYTNGTEMVPIFRMKQWFEHKPERKTGKWIPYLSHGLTVMCSECGSRFDRPWHHCPNCGAKMEGEENG